MKGEIRIEREVFDVQTMAPMEPDPDWVYVDRAGHEHRFVDGQLPSLVMVDDPPFWCEDCGDLHQHGHHECAVCREFVTPKFRSSSGSPMLVAGRTRAFLDGEEIEVERAMQMLKERAENER